MNNETADKIDKIIHGVSHSTEPSSGAVELLKKYMPKHVITIAKTREIAANKFTLNLSIEDSLEMYLLSPI